MMRPLWKCPACGREFANRNQSHACGRYSLEQILDNATPEVRTLFLAFAGCVKEIGPVKVLPEKSRVAFQVRMSFAAVSLKKSWLDGHVVLARRFEHPRFRRIDSISRRNHVHHFRLLNPDEIDDDVRAWLREAYSVGKQEHLGAPEDPT